MNKIILFSFVLLLFPIGNSFGAVQSQLGDDVFIFVQSIVRNSDGTLAVYLESSKFSEINYSELNSFLDFEVLHGKSGIIIIDSQDYQVVRRVQSQSFAEDGLVARTSISYENSNREYVALAIFPHDGYSIKSGDTLETMWTFIRSVS